MKSFTSIPQEKPQTPLLDSLALPEDLPRLKVKELEQLADELREFLLWSVGQSGGHLGSGLGVVELTLALLKSYQVPKIPLFGI